jgi:hypothetical protein
MKKKYFICGIIIMIITSLMLVFLPPYIPKSYNSNVMMSTEMMLIFGILITTYGWVEDKEVKK